MRVLRDPALENTLSLIAMSVTLIIVGGTLVAAGHKPGGIALIVLGAVVCVIAIALFGYHVIVSRNEPDLAHQIMAAITRRRLTKLNVEMFVRRLDKFPGTV